MIKLKINVFILFFTFSTQTCATPKENENNHLYHINKNIYSIKLNYASKLRIETFGQSNSLKPQIYIEHGYEF